MKHILFFLLVLFLPNLSPSISSSSCDLLTQAFSSVSNFHHPNDKPCNEIQQLILPSANLTGTVSWTSLQNISTLRTVDLSNNSLRGSIPGAFWSPSSLLQRLNLAGNQLGGTLRFQPVPTIQHLNLSGNRFTNAFNVSSLPSLRSLDLSCNSLSLVPSGLQHLGQLNYLDVSRNSMSGFFPGDFPAVQSLRFLNISFNNLSGSVDGSIVSKFGRSAFVKAGGSLTLPAAPTASAAASTKHNEQKQRENSSSSSSRRRRRRKRRTHKVEVVAAAVAGSVISTIAVVVVVVFLLCGCRGRKEGWKEEEKGVKVAEEVPGWVAEARWGAAVVVFEKPLMDRLKFSELAAATSGFGRETQLGDGSARSGAAYRAALPGDMNVVVRVMERARGMEEAEAVELFRDLSRLRHPNLLPLLGYCIAGPEKLVLYEYIERGNLHQWLHELPAADHSGTITTEDWTEDTSSSSSSRDHWPTRHGIALGIARGLAFLHQGWAGSSQPIVHGHLVPSNILIDEDLRPHISDFAAGSGGETTEGNVYSYGLLLLELVTGRGKCSAQEVEKVRKSVKEGRGYEEVDIRMRMRAGEGIDEGKWESEMVECLGVGYLCTAQSPEKRPTMQQVVGLLKDIRPSSSSSATPAAATTSSSSL